MPSVLVLVLVVALAWAVVLVPVFRHRDDALREARSFQLVSRASRVLVRRRPAVGVRRYLLMPRRVSLPVRPMPIAGPRVIAAGEGLAPMSVTMHPGSVERSPARTARPDGADRPPAPKDSHAAPKQTRSAGPVQLARVPAVPVPATRNQRVDGTAARVAAQRRVRVLAVLAALVVLQALLAMLVGPGFVIGMLLSGGLLAAYVVVLRKEALRREALRQDRAREQRREAGLSSHPARGTARSRSSMPAPRPARSAVPAGPTAMTRPSASTAARERQTDHERAVVNA